MKTTLSLPAMPVPAVWVIGSISETAILPRRVIHHLTTGATWAQDCGFLTSISQVRGTFPVWKDALHSLDNMETVYYSKVTATFHLPPQYFGGPLPSGEGWVLTATRMALRTYRYQVST